MYPTLSILTPSFATEIRETLETFEDYNRVHTLICPFDTLSQRERARVRGKSKSKNLPLITEAGSGLERTGRRIT
jgi:hypothetical protein